jgi:hypothetical protein
MSQLQYTIVDSLHIGSPRIMNERRVFTEEVAAGGRGGRRNDM